MNASRGNSRCCRPCDVCGVYRRAEFPRRFGCGCGTNPVSCFFIIAIETMQCQEVRRMMSLLCPKRHHCAQNTGKRMTIFRCGIWVLPLRNPLKPVKRLRPACRRIGRSDAIQVLPGYSAAAHPVPVRSPPLRTTTFTVPGRSVRTTATARPSNACARFEV